ncbi:hypothetical protein GWI33_018903 [Rhynchophorus ferrugineus]|uniref:Uncharacterized protein n=1 Tax=Rhynchophorus ferrugineus TaxID=354439 RepID=A0A834HSM9_RHYFE|nr:hypothetical protein GWI33_018903 [Rhynchophorus ferrugineus]
MATFTVGLVLLGLGAVLGVPVQDQVQYKTADAAFLDKQNKVLKLFKDIIQPSQIEEHLEICKTVVDPVQWLQVHKSSFSKPEVVDTVIQFFHNDYLVPKNQPFSIGQEEHLEQAIAFFKLLYYSLDFDIFHRVAVVLREFLNEGLFVYTTSLAVVHRPDCYGLILPAIYEVFPWYFFNTETLQEVYKHKMVHLESTGGGHHVIYANYTGQFLNLHPEQSDLSYYLEDVGINAYHYYCHLHYPFWMDGEEFKLKNDKRGELTLDLIQSLVARYYLERLSHGKGEIPILDLHVPFEVPFYPSLQYPNGEPFPERPNFVSLEDSRRNSIEPVGSKYENSFDTVHQCVNRICEVIDSGRVVTKHDKKFNIYHEPHPVNVFGNLLHANEDSPYHDYYCSYTAYAKHILGYAHRPVSYHHVVPSALDHPETCLRDPAVYSIYKKFLSYYHKFQRRLKPYTKDDLVFPGVTVDKVEIDRLITFFEDFYNDGCNAVWKNPVELKTDAVKVLIVQQRLNHKPFTYKIHVNSVHDTQAVVRIFLGPKYDEFGNHINITFNRVNFVPIDSFKWHLHVGANVIKRSSHESSFYGVEKPPYHLLSKKVSEAHKGVSKFHITGKDSYFYFPSRYMLPKGQLQDMIYNYPHPGTGGGYIDEYPTFYPLDRHIKFDKLFVDGVPNSFFHETKIFHRTIEEAQVQHPPLPF